MPSVPVTHLKHVITSFSFNHGVERRHVQPSRRYDVALALLLQDHREPKRNADRNLWAERTVLGTGSWWPRALALTYCGEVRSSSSKKL